MKVCENEHIMPENSNFCPICGKKERVVQKFCSNCGASLYENDMFCRNCGHQINLGSAPNAAEPVFKGVMPLSEIVKASFRERVKHLNGKKLFSVLLFLSVVCLVGTVSTNIQQFIQYSREKEETEKVEKKVEGINEDYQAKMTLYEMGLIDAKPQKPYYSYNNHYSNRDIATPYNCLNIPVSVIFWMLAFTGVVTVIIVYLKKPGESPQERSKLQLTSGLALISILVGVIYWASTFHF